MPFNPVGSVCVVTGGASGIGRALCHHLASAGAAKVIVVDLSFQKAQQVAERELPPHVGIAMAADCGEEGDIRRVIVETEYRVAPIDAFFCNAGISGGILENGIEVANDEWHNMWQVNVMQTVYVARHLFPRFAKRGGGNLVVTASAAGLLTLVGNLPYSVTKHAAVAVAEWLQMSFGHQGIHVSCLCPQAVQTNMLGGQDPTSIWGGNVMSPQQVAKITVDAMCKDKFMVLPHQNVEQYFRYKGKDYDAWLRGMQKLHARNREMLQNMSKMPCAKL